LNPLIIYKDYDFEDDVGYFITIKPVNLNDKMKVEETLYTYETLERNFEGESNVIEFTSSETGKSIFTAPVNKDAMEFVQIAQCQKSVIQFKLVDALSKTQEVIPETPIASDTKNFYKIVNNILLETELLVYGSSGNKVFVRHSGIRSGYNLDIIDNPKISFNSTTNQIIMQHPINTYERIEYTVYVGGEGSLSNQDITLCDIAEGKQITAYSKSIISYAETASIPINFDKVGLKTGDKFEAIVYYEQKLQTKMAFYLIYSMEQSEKSK
jgi:hypothetical protein